MFVDGVMRVFKLHTLKAPGTNSGLVFRHGLTTPRSIRVNITFSITESSKSQRLQLSVIVCWKTLLSSSAVQY